MRSTKERTVFNLRGHSHTPLGQEERPRDPHTDSLSDIQNYI